VLSVQKCYTCYARFATLRCAALLRDPMIRTRTRTRTVTRNPRPGNAYTYTIHVCPCYRTVPGHTPVPGKSLNVTRNYTIHADKRLFNQSQNIQSKSKNGRGAGVKHLTLPARGGVYIVYITLQFYISHKKFYTV
jgi:hypothetical protein